MPRRAVAALIVALAVACGNGGGTGRSTAAVRCPLDALRRATKPVQITMWHQLAANNARVLEAITDRFNRSQDQVRVKLVDQSAESSMLPKYRAGFTSGDLPDLVQMDETTLQTMLDTHSTLPVQTCVDAEHYDLSDFLPKAISYYKTQGVLRSFPFNVSNPVLFYNKTAFAKAGLDPERPPRTLDEVREYSKQIVARGVARHGMAMRITPFVNEFWYSKNGQQYANNGNGRERRATKARLDNATGLAVWTWWHDMVSSGLMLSTGPQEGQSTHLLALTTGDAAMTIEGSGVLGPIMNVLGGGQFPDVKVGVGPLPGVRGGGGVQTAEGSLWIVARGTPARQAAAWKFLKYLVAPAQVKTFHLETGYLPIRKSVAASPEVQALWKRSPEYRVAYDQLLAGPTTLATTGPVIGDFLGVREAVRNGLEAMLIGGKTPREALAQTQRDADVAIRAYNERTKG